MHSRFAVLRGTKTPDPDGQFKAEIVGGVLRRRPQTSVYERGEVILFPNFGATSGTWCVPAASGDVSRAQYSVQTANAVMLVLSAGGMLHCLFKHRDNPGCLVTGRFWTHDAQLDGFL